MKRTTKKVIFAALGFLTQLLPDYGLGIRLRGMVYQPFLGSCGKNFKMGIGAHIYNPDGVFVGDNVYIGFHTYLGDGQIIIEDEVVIGPFCVIAGGNHTRKDGSIRFGGYEVKPVRIGRGTWLAAHCTVVPGTIIAEGNIIAAGAVVTRHTEPHCLYAGVPAVKIKELS